MTIRELLLQGSRIIKNGTESDTAWLDACILFCHLGSIDKARLLACLRDDLAVFPSHVQLTIEQNFLELCQKRSGGYPIAYICGRKEFYGRDFLVDESVLIPRPETEILVEWVLETCRTNAQALQILDCCTGSGCIAISLALELGAPVTACDLSPAALRKAQENADRLGASRLFRTFLSDLLTDLPFPAYSLDVITVNPPYVPSAESQAALGHGWSEPLMALDGGPDGLALIRRLLPQARRLLKPSGWLFLEYGDNQSQALLGLLAAEKFRDTEIRTDLAGLDRIVRARSSEYYVD